MFERQYFYLRFVENHAPAIRPRLNAIYEEGGEAISKQAGDRAEVHGAGNELHESLHRPAQRTNRPTRRAYSRYSAPYASIRYLSSQRICQLIATTAPSRMA